MDVLFTVTATDQPLADQLLLTNIAQSSSSNTNGAGQVATDGVQVELTEPELTVTKGVVATDAVAPEFTPDPPAPAAFSAPGGADPRHTGTIASDDLAATPIDANLTGVDAGDLVTFALTVENTGSGTNGAFDVTVSDDLPAGFVVPAGGINLGVVDGTGATLAVSELAGGLLGSGVRLDDGSDTGSLGPFDPTAGTNLAIITYDLEVAGSVEPGSTLTNTASLDRYAGTEGGPNHLDEPATDDAEVVTADPTVAKSLVATSEPHTDGADLAVGEIARFRIEVVVPEGTSSDASITDELPAGLAFLDDGTATVALVSDGGAGLASSTLTGAGLGLDGDGSTVDAITPTIVVPSGAISGGAGDGADVTIDLGTLTNADDDADTELVVVELNALVRNAADGHRRSLPGEPGELRLGDRLDRPLRPGRGEPRRVVARAGQGGDAGGRCRRGGHRHLHLRAVQRVGRRRVRRVAAGHGRPPDHRTDRGRDRARRWRQRHRRQLRRLHHRRRRRGDARRIERARDRLGRPRCSRRAR